MKFSVENLIAAPFTPMNQDESINVEAIPAYGQCLINQGRGQNLAILEVKSKTLLTFCKNLNKLWLILSS